MSTATPPSPPRARILSVPLVVFLAVVAAVLLLAAFDRFVRLPAQDPVVLLSDGDLDGAERRAALSRVVERGQESEQLSERWAGLLAAVALADQEAYAAALARLAPDVRGLPGAAPAPPDREALSLGDPMLASVGAAFWAEIEGHTDAARLRWRQVEAQCQLAPGPLAAELAATALARLR